MNRVACFFSLCFAFSSNPDISVITDMDESLQQIYSSSHSFKPERLFQLKKHKKQQVQSGHITNLPDEILSGIISHLTLVEAARTSVLSRRWNKLWYNFHGDLEFDDTKKIMLHPEDTLEQVVRDCLYSNRQVLQLLSSPSFGAFRITCYNMDESCKSHLDFCVQFAMTKRLRSFKLDTMPFPLLFVTEEYNFPLEFYAWIKKPCGLDSISSLTSISLKQVNVSEDLINHLLVNCSLLESLHVGGSSRELLNPKFIGGTLKLKYLEIWGFNLESIEISAPNLSRLITRATWKFKLLIMNAPKLVELSIPVEIIKNRIESVSSFLPHLERLTWDFSLVNNEYQTMHNPRFVEHHKLRHLTWKLGSYYNKFTITLNSLLEASPFLQKFTLVIDGISPERHTDRVTSVIAKHPHKCLKVLEIDGFTGSATEYKLILYFLANTTSLEEIILDITQPRKRGTPWKSEPSHLRRCKLSADHLKKHIPPNVSLVILEE